MPIMPLAPSSSQTWDVALVAKAESRTSKESNFLITIVGSFFVLPERYYFSQECQLSVGRLLLSGKPGNNFRLVLSF